MLPQVVVLFGAPDTHAVTDTHLDAARRAAGRCGDVRWLAKGEAVEFDVEDAEDDLVGLYRRLAAAISDAPVDLAVVPTSDRRKRLMVADMDATIVAEESLDELASEIGAQDEVAKITAKAMRGDMPFEEALRARVRLLKGLPASRLDALADRLTLHSGALTLCATMRAQGARLVLATGGFGPVAARVAEICGFDVHAANELEQDEAGRLTGAPRLPIRGAEAKETTLRKEAESLGGLAQAMAIGDGANDAAMLRAAGLGVAFRGKPAAEAAADAAIRNGDLTGALYLQGIPKDAFCES